MALIALGELLMDLSPAGQSAGGRPLYALNPGGAPANVLVAAARQGTGTAMISAVGNDILGRSLLETLRGEGIDTTGVQVTENACTTMAAVALDENGERAFSFFRKPGADMLIDSEQIAEARFTDCRIFHFGSLSLSAPMSKAATLAAIAMARDAGAKIAFDPNWRADVWPEQAVGLGEIKSAMGSAHYLKLSEEEFGLCAGHANLEKGLPALFGQYPGLELAVVTLGEKGCRYATQNSDGLVAGCPAAAVDTTGAGDVFWGVLLSALHNDPGLVSCSRTDALERALYRANRAGALCTMSYGAMAVN